MTEQVEELGTVILDGEHESWETVALGWAMVTVDPVPVVEIEAPFGSVAGGPPTPMLEDVLVEVLATLRTAVARTPSGIRSWFRPETRHTY